MLTATNFLVAAAITFLITPKIMQLGMNLGATDQPNSRKQHTTPMVRLGGIGILVGFFVAIFSSSLINKYLLGTSYISNDLALPILITAFFYFLIGLSDDLLGLSPWPRLAFQTIAAIALWSYGLRIEVIDMGWLFESQRTTLYLPSFISLIATVIWLVGTTNAINWLDGLDGLAAGVASIAAFGLIFVSFSLNQIHAGLLAASLTGAAIGFLRHNIYPARLLMGDSGSYFLGFTLAAISLIGCSQATNPLLPSQSGPFLFYLPILLLFIPLTDMTAVVVARIRRGKSPFYPDRNHFHHRLLNTGLSHHKVVLLIYALAQWFACLALVLAQTNFDWIWFAGSSLILLATLIRSYSQFKQ